MPAASCAGFYRGRIAEAIVKTVHEHGGVMTVDDLDHHHTEACDPITTTYRGYHVYEVPPPTAVSVTDLHMCIR